MKYFYANNFDTVSENFDFDTETPITPKLLVNQYNNTPEGTGMDGMLVSLAIMKDRCKQAMRTPGLLRKQAHWGVDKATRGDYPLIIDSGAFTYVNEYVPPMTSKDVVEIYLNTEATHCLALDHIPLKGLTSEIEKQLTLKKEQLDNLKHNCLLSSIFPGWDVEATTLINDLEVEVADLQKKYTESLKENKRRWDISMQNAEDFLKYCKDNNVPFTPVATAHGWDAETYEEAGYLIKEMGYNYMAVGGLVPIASSSPKVFEAISSAAKGTGGQVPIHVFGIGSMYRFNYKQMVGFGVESFDSASPMVKSISGTANLFWGNKAGYMALKVPLVRDDNRGALNKLIKAGSVSMAKAKKLEQLCISNILSLDTTTPVPTQKILDDLQEFAYLWGEEHTKDKIVRMRKTIDDKVWTQCGCKACKQHGAHIIMFRGGQRGTARCSHNLLSLKQRLSDWENGIIDTVEESEEETLYEQYFLQ